MCFSSPRGCGGGSHLSAQEQTKVTRGVECGWAKFPWSCILKEGEGNDGGFAGVVALPVYFRRFQNTLGSLRVTLPCLRAASPCCGCWPSPGLGVFSPLCLKAAVFGLTTGLDHARVHVVIQSRKNFPECLEKPETLNGFQGLLMWPVQEIAVRQ